MLFAFALQDLISEMHQVAYSKVEYQVRLIVEREHEIKENQPLFLGHHLTKVVLDEWPYIHLWFESTPSHVSKQLRIHFSQGVFNEMHLDGWLSRVVHKPVLAPVHEQRQDRLKH